MPHKPLSELLEDNKNLLRNDAAAASIQPEEVRVLLDNIAETSDVDTKNNAIAAQSAQLDASRGIANADNALDKIGKVEQRLVGIDNNLSELNAGGDTADWALDENTDPIPENKLGNAKDQTARNAASTADAVAKEARGTANSNFDKIGDIERRLQGIDNDLTELNAGGDTADWALDENTDQIPSNKLGNAVDATARSSATNALNIAGRNSTIINALPVFTTATLTPAGVRGRDLPSYIALELANKVDRRNIAQVEVRTQGQLLTRVNNVTAASQITQLNSHGGIVNIELANDLIETIANNLNSSVQDLRIELHYKFEGTNLGTGTPADQVDDVHMGVNNDSFLHQPELIGSANFNITTSNVFSSGASAIIVPQIGFGMINLGRRASNQAMDLSHHIVNFTTITALTAGTHGGAATDINTFGFVSANRNYRIGRDNGNRLLIASGGASTDSIPATLYRS